MCLCVLIAKCFCFIQDEEIVCSVVKCQRLNCSEAPIMVPHSCCPVCPGKIRSSLSLDGIWSPEESSILRFCFGLIMLSLPEQRPSSEFWHIGVQKIFNFQSLAKSMLADRTMRLSKTETANSYQWLPEIAWKHGCAHAYGLPRHWPGLACVYLAFNLFQWNCKVYVITLTNQIQQ